MFVILKLYYLKNNGASTDIIIGCLFYKNGILNL